MRALFHLALRLLLLDGARRSSALNMSKRHIGSFALVMLVSATGALAQSPPINDDFINRTVLTGSSLAFSGTLAGATLESAEPNDPFGNPLNGGSVWWTWTAPASTTVVIAMQRDYSAGDYVQTYLSVYTGTNLSALTQMDEESFDRPPGRYVAFSATAGASYQFRVAGDWGRPFSLKLTATNPPVFITQPADCQVSPYGSAFFSAIAEGLRSWNRGHPSTTYQWAFNGVPIPRQTAPSLLIHNVTTNRAGRYSVIASNAGGIMESSPAMLTVNDTNPVPRLAALRPGAPTQFSFALTGEGGRWYKIESSQDLKNWVSPGWVQTTNATSFLSVPRLGPTHFVRASLNVPTDVCVARLKQLRAAQYLYAIEFKLSPSSPVALSDIMPYLSLGAAGNILSCPEGGSYGPPATILGKPDCSIHGRGHEITDP